jgi:hypothetical protein
MPMRLQLMTATVPLLGAASPSPMAPDAGDALPLRIS